MRLNLIATIFTLLPVVESQSSPQHGSLTVPSQPETGSEGQIA